MSKILFLNASPRKKWNAAMLLDEAARGAESAGAQTRLINLYDLDFKGCVSCFACKRREKAAEICVIKDDLRPVLEETMQADAIIMGTPIYYGDVTAALRAFLERLLFMNSTYLVERPTKFGGKIASGVIYTMNVPDAMLQAMDYEAIFDRNREYLGMLLNGPSEYLAVTDTLQFADYSKYMGNRFDPVHKAKMREEKFPNDLKAAWEMGARLASAS